MARRPRTAIEAAARRQGYTVLSATYEPITPLEMGDCLGGWFVKLDGGESIQMVGGITAEAVVGEIMNLPMRARGRPEGRPNEGPGGRADSPTQRGERDR